MAKEQGNFERSVPLKARSKYARLDDILATASPQDLFSSAQKAEYQALGIADPNFYHLAEAQQSSLETGVQHLIEVELPLTEHALEIDAPIIFVPKTTAATTHLFQLFTHIKRDNSLLDRNLVNSVLERNDTMVLFQRNLDTDFVRDLLSSPNAYYAVDVPDQESLMLARRINSDRHLRESLVITHDFRMARKDEVNLMRVLAVAEPEKSTGLKKDQLFNYVIQPALWVASQYGRFPKGSLKRSVEIAEEVEAEFPRIPRIRAKSVPEPWGENSFGYLESLTKERFAWLTNTKRLEDHERTILKRRLQDELDLIESFQFADYLLICKEITDYCRSRGIEFTTTGSGTHSLVNQLLGITTVDAADLNPEVFISQKRSVNLPDIDIMVAYESLDEVNRFLKNQYPEEVTNLVQIRTLREGKIDELIRKANQRLSKEEKIHLTPDQRAQLANAGLPYQEAIHASGKLFARRLVPQGRVAGNQVAQLNAAAVEILQIPYKIDTLPSVGLERIATAKKLLKEDGIRLEIPPDDPEALAYLFSRAPKIGINTADSPHLERLFAHLGSLVEHPTIEHITLALALARPAAAALRRDLYTVLETGESELMGFPEIDAILEKSGYTLIYDGQEEEITQLLEEQGDQYSNKVLANLTSQLELFTGYAFKHGHARAFAQDIVYPQAFLAVRFPEYFGAGILKTVADRRGQRQARLTYPAQAYINQILRMAQKIPGAGMQILLPDINNLPEYPLVHDGNIIVGKKLLSRKKDVLNQYAILLNKLASASDLKQYIEAQIDAFGLSFTSNPIHRFPEPMHFNPDLPEQTIVGFPINWRTVRDRYGQPVLLATFDSGEVIHTSVPARLARTRIKKVDQYGFYQFRIRRTNIFPETWDII